MTDQICYKKTILALTVVTACMLTAKLASTSASDDGSLFLTPMLDRGDAELAKNMSLVASQELHNIPHSHAGFITVNKELGNHLFFWHFPSLGNSTAPLLLWLNGGPTVSSMVGLLLEHGPMEVKKSTKGVHLTRRKYTWVGPFSVVYVDNPVGTGYSFSEQGEAGYRLKKADYTADLCSFVLQFFKMFPEYKTRDFYISGQSFAGKFISALAYRIHERKDHEFSEVPLRGIILGAPLYDTVTQFTASFDFYQHLGFISRVEKDTLTDDLKDVYQQFVIGDWQNVTSRDVLPKMVPTGKFFLPSYDNYVTEIKPDFVSVGAIMGTPQIRQAVHVGHNHTFLSANSPLWNMYGRELLISNTLEMAGVMDNYKVLIYNGDYDLVISSSMIEAALLNTPWSMLSTYNESGRTFWMEDGRYKGFYLQVGQFCRVIIHGAGHHAPHDAPDVTLDVIIRFVNDGCIKKLNNTTST